MLYSNSLKSDKEHREIKAHAPQIDWQIMMVLISCCRKFGLMFHSNMKKDSNHYVKFYWHNISQNYLERY